MSWAVGSAEAWCHLGEFDSEDVDLEVAACRRGGGYLQTIQLSSFSYFEIYSYIVIDYSPSVVLANTRSYSFFLAIFYTH